MTKLSFLTSFLEKVCHYFCSNNSFSIHFQFLGFFYFILYLKLSNQRPHCEKYRNFTGFPGVEITVFFTVSSVDFPILIWKWNRRIDIKLILLLLRLNSKVLGEHLIIYLWSIAANHFSYMSWPYISGNDLIFLCYCLIP